ncbi:MAG: glycosyltransferase family 4 protein [Bacteroidota bacterium]
MNILFICDEYPPGKNGGIGTSVQILGRELVKQGHSIFVAGLYSYNYGQKDYEVDNGIKVWRLRYGLNLHLSSESRFYNLLDKLPDSIKRHLNGEKAFAKFIDFINKLIDNEKIDVIEIADYNNFCQHVGFVAKWPKFKVPLILKSHGSHTYFSDEQNIPPIKYLHDTDIELYKRANAISAVSKYTADKDIKLFDLNKEVKILYNGINISDKTTTQIRERKLVVFTGSLAYKKGIFSLIKAWNIVYEKFPDANLKVIGKGKTTDLMPLLNREAVHSVDFKGHISRDVLFSTLSKATLAVFPSYSETFGLGAVEAMSLYCPVIYTKRSCGPEIVKDKTDGLLVDPDNIHEIAESIITLIENEALRNKLAASGFESVKSRFDIKYIASSHIEFYKDVIINFNKNESSNK